MLCCLLKHAPVLKSEAHAAFPGFDALFIRMAAHSRTFEGDGERVFDVAKGSHEIDPVDGSLAGDHVQVPGRGDVGLCAWLREVEAPDAEIVVKVCVPQKWAGLANHGCWVFTVCVGMAAVNDVAQIWQFDFANKVEDLAGVA